MNPTRPSARPLSPHLSIYAFRHTMALSILHRISGVWLTAGIVVLVAWLASLAAGEGAYACAVRVMSGWPMRILLLGWLAAFCYHLANGLRHLAWDLGYGFEKRSARRSAVVVVLAALLLFAALSYLLLCPQGALP